MNEIICLNLLTSEPAEEYHAKADRFMSSHQLLDFMKCPWLHLLRDYIPSLGRWPSRDPVEEFGGNHLYLFIENSPTTDIDLLGLAPQLCGIDKNGMPIYCPNPPSCYNCPEQSKPDPQKKCKTKENDCSLEDTGVVIFKTKKLPPGTKNANVHYWLAWNGGTTDANSIALWTGVYSGIVLRDAGYTNPDNEPDNKKLKSCEYDFAKLHQCISDEVAAWFGKDFGLCYAWTSHLLSKCTAAAKK